MIVRFVVPLDPVPQGSMYSPKGTTKMLHSKRGKGRTVESWRKEAKECAFLAMRRKKIIDGPVSVRVTFYLTRPVSRANAEFPDRKPDLDKLERALGDALEGIVLTQDSRIVHWDARKLYADENPAGGVPCSAVTVTEVGER